MNLTILVDLDDTLLGNKMEAFIPAYLNAIGSYLADLVEPEKLVKTMIFATHCMFNNTRPDRTLKEAFDPCFYPKLGLIEGEVREHFDRFYQEVFPTLKRITKFLPETISFIETAFSRGYQVGIATNPAFPLTAIKQRLEWAELPPQKYPFALIPSYETFHFSKPNPAYFAEFLTMLGWPEGPMIMIGNDLNHDVCGSQEMGIPVYWVSEEDHHSLNLQYVPNGSGTLEDFFLWFDSQPAENLIPNYTSITALIATLRGSPAGLSNVLSRVAPETWTKRPRENSWCLTEIACHLRDVEQEINLPRIKKIIQEENPFIPGVDSDSWAKERQYITQDGPKAFKAFINARIETLEILDKLRGDDWSRPVRHAIFGPTQMQEISHIMAGHDRLHGIQIRDVLQEKTA